MNEIEKPSPHPDGCDEETLRSAYAGQRAEALQHRATIHNTFALTMTGLTALLAGVSAASYISVGGKTALSIAVFVVSLTSLMFMGLQRFKTHECMKILIRIEEELGMFKGSDPVLPPQYREPQGLTCAHECGPYRFGFTRNDCVEALGIILLAVVALFVLWSQASGVSVPNAPRHQSDGEQGGRHDTGTAPSSGRGKPLSAAAQGTSVAARESSIGGACHPRGSKWAESRVSSGNA